MKTIHTPLSGLIVIEPTIFKDDRGYFLESYQTKRYQELGIPPFVQANISRSKGRVLRGLHYQLPHAQGKLVHVTRGAVWDVAVDIRLQSETYGQWFGIELSDENQKQLYIPPGFAHGFCVLSDSADFMYQCTDFYTPSAEHGIKWDDPHLQIPWPIQNPILSTKDELYPCLKDISHENLFT